MKKRIYCVFLIVLLVASLLTITVNAADLSFTTVMTPSQENVSEATEVVITVGVSNLNVGDNGINSFSATLSYDNNVFETPTDSSVEGLNSWNATYSTRTGKIALLKNSFVKQDQDIMSITLKTKEGVTQGTSGTVSLTNIQVSNSADDIDGANVSTTITVGTASPLNIARTNTGNRNVLNVNRTNTRNNTVNRTNTTNTTNNVQQTPRNTNTAPVTPAPQDPEPQQNIPYTGPSGSAIVKIILGVIVLALIVYTKIRKMDGVK